MQADRSLLYPGARAARPLPAMARAFAGRSPQLTTPLTLRWLLHSARRTALNTRPAMPNVLARPSWPSPHHGGDLGSTEAVKLVVACNGYSGPAKTRAAKN